MSVQQILDRRRQINKKNLENRINEVCTKAPRICEINSELKLKNIERINSVIAGKNVFDLSIQIEELIVEKRQILLKLGYPLDYLELKYHCEICKDTGIVDRKACECRKKLEIEELYSKSEIENIVKVENFENFNLSLFRKDIQSGEIISPFENMKKVKEELESYSKYFEKNAESIYLYGKVGTGKTYLINSIAKVVMDKGYSVIYLSEFQLLDIISSYKFARSHEKENYRSKYEMLLECDLLIIDDLGAESPNDQSRSNIFEILNSRLLKKAPVIISSNLKPESLKTIYGDRIYSRILGMYFIVKLYGNDVRMR